jgi:hypothetical protein
MVIEEGCCRPRYVEGGVVCHFLVSESAAARKTSKAPLWQPRSKRTT